MVNNDKLLTNNKIANWHFLGDNFFYDQEFINRCIQKYQQT